MPLLALCFASLLALPEAVPDLGGVTFDFVRMSAARMVARETEPLSIRTSFCDFLDGTFAVSEGQVGELGFIVWSTNEVRRIGLREVVFRLELPRGIGFAGTTFPHGTSVTTRCRPDGSSTTEFRPQGEFVSSSCVWWGARHVLVSAEGKAGTCGTGRLVISGLCDDQAFTVSSRPVRFIVVPRISTARPKRYANGSFCGNAFGFDEPTAVERLTRFMAEAGVSWLIPDAASAYPALPVWRRHGMRLVTPAAGGWCANGYQLETGGKVPWTDRFTLVRSLEAKFRALEDHSVCPLSVIERTSYCRDVLEPTIRRHLTGGVNGLWANWEPYMYTQRGCGCERCGREFARFLNRSWLEIYPVWPSCSFRGGRFAAEGRRFRSVLHGRMVCALDAVVREATGGDRSLGLIPGLHFEQMLSGWRRSNLMAESRPIDFAGCLRWINCWGPYLPWHKFLPYEEERGRFIGHWLVFSDLRRSVDREWPSERRPRILSAPQGTCDDWLTQPEDFERMMDACFFNGLDACCPWTFPAGADARYWRAFANATARAAKYEDFVFGGKNVGNAVSIRTVREYAAPIREVLANMPWARDVSPLQANAYEKGKARIVAVFNGWETGEAYVTLACEGLSGAYEVVSDDGVLWAKSREDPSYDAGELKRGVTLVVGAARCRVFEIRPVGSLGPTVMRKILTNETVEQLYASRRPRLKRLAEEDATRAAIETEGMIRYD